MKYLYTAILLVLVSASAFSEERVFIGQVTDILLVPEGHRLCRPHCPDQPEEIDGLVRVCVSNSCGCGEARIRVIEALTREPKGRRTQVHYRLGEWCMADFPLTDETILIWEAPNQEPKWSPIENYRSREATIDLEHFKYLDSPVLKELSASDGRVRLSELRRALRH